MARKRKRGKPTQDAVLGAIRVHPGSSYYQLGQVLGVHASTVAYHVHRLSRRRLVAIERHPRGSRLYPVDSGWCRRARELHAALNASALAALRLAAETGSVSRPRIMAMGVTRSAARWVLAQLLRAGVIAHLGRGVYALTPELSGCARRALGERARCSCVEEPARQRRTANSRPSPSGRMDDSSSGWLTA